MCKASCVSWVDSEHPEQIVCYWEVSVDVGGNRQPNPMGLTFVHSYSRFRKIPSGSRVVLGKYKRLEMDKGWDALFSSITHTALVTW